MSVILGIDPGNVQSAYVFWDGETIRTKGITPNEIMRTMIRKAVFGFDADIVAIENVECMGMPVGKTVLDTVRWIGRYEEAAMQQAFPVQLIGRSEIKMALCGSKRAKDGNIAQALKDRFGEPYTFKMIERYSKKGQLISPGRVRVPGILDGVHDDIWQALAVAVVAQGRVL